MGIGVGELAMGTLEDLVFGYGSISDGVQAAYT